jgi:hypothetical protein
LDYVRDRRQSNGMTVGLFSRCLGANATMFAMVQRPEKFRDVRCMVAPQPISVRVILERMLEYADVRTGLMILRIASGCARVGGSTTCPLSKPRKA